GRLAAATAAEPGPRRAHPCPAAAEAGEKEAGPAQAGGEEAGPEEACRGQAGGSRTRAGSRRCSARPGWVAVAVGPAAAAALSSRIPRIADGPHANAGRFLSDRVPPRA